MGNYAFCSCCFSSLQPYWRLLVLSSVCSTSLFVFGCDCLYFKPYSTFLVFLCCGSFLILSALPTLFYLLFLLIFSPFTVVLGTICWLCFIVLLVLLFWITASLIRTSIRSKYCVYFAFTYYACKWICYQPAHRPPQCVQFIQQSIRCFVIAKPILTTHPPFRNQRVTLWFTYW